MGPHVEALELAPAHAQPLRPLKVQRPQPLQPPVPAARHAVRFHVRRVGVAEAEALQRDVLDGRLLRCVRDEKRACSPRDNIAGTLKRRRWTEVPNHRWIAQSVRTRRERSWRLTEGGHGQLQRCVGRRGPGAVGLEVERAGLGVDVVLVRAVQQLQDVFDEPVLACAQHDDR